MPNPSNNSNRHKKRPGQSLYGPICATKSYLLPEFKRKTSWTYSVKNLTFKMKDDSISPQAKVTAIPRPLLGGEYRSPKTQNARRREKRTSLKVRRVSCKKSDNRHSKTAPQTPSLFTRSRTMVAVNCACRRKHAL